MPKVTIYASAYCPYCLRAVKLLESKKVQMDLISVDDPQKGRMRRAEMMARSKRHTVPQIWIGATHVGGCDELMALERSGQLDALLQGTKTKGE
jgi:glutaredoxin 3